MLQSQRILIVVSALIISVLLHTTFCEWQRHASTSTLRTIAVWTHVDPPPSRTIRRAPPRVQIQQRASTPTTGMTTVRRGAAGRYGEYSGLFIQGSSDSRASALIFGVAMPIGLLSLGTYLAIDVWRTRLANANRCVSCGYSRNGLDPGTLCPECGSHPDKPRTVHGSTR